MCSFGINCTAKCINHQKEYHLNLFCSASVTGPHKCVSAVSFAVSVDCHQHHCHHNHQYWYSHNWLGTVWQHCGGWITCWQHGVGLVCNIVMWWMVERGGEGQHSDRIGCLGKKLQVSYCNVLGGSWIKLFGAFWFSCSNDNSNIMKGVPDQQCQVQEEMLFLQLFCALCWCCQYCMVFSFFK
jgi:hypothetical protein